MAAIITDALKKNFMVQTIADINNTSSYYYAAIGKSDVWDNEAVPDTPRNSLRDGRLARYGFQSYKLVTDSSIVIPRSNWSSGAIYSGWDDNGVGHPTNNFYVMTGSQQVYVCLQQARNSAGLAVPSTVEPTSTGTDAFYTNDGYVWKYLYSIGALSASRYLAANFMPVQRIDSVDDETPASALNQVTIQNAAVDGQLIGYQVISGGTGYETIPSVVIRGNGNGATARAFIEGGAVVKVEIDSDGSGDPAIGSGYQYASVEIAAPTGLGGIIAKIRPVLSPVGGFGQDPVNDLKASAMMLNIKLSGDEGGDFIITTNANFRQVGLVRNPTRWEDSAFTSLTGSSLKYMTLSSVSETFQLGAVSSPITITGANSGAYAILDDVFDSGDVHKLWYHQTEDTGFRSFEEDEEVTAVGGNGIGQTEEVGVDPDTNAYINGAINPSSGELLYLDNRVAIPREEGQTEDIKIVIQL
jgi:hypothetical protein